MVTCAVIEVGLRFVREGSLMHELNYYCTVTPTLTLTLCHKDPMTKNYSDH